MHNAHSLFVAIFVLYTLPVYLNLYILPVSLLFSLLSASTFACRSSFDFLSCDSSSCKRRLSLLALLNSLSSSSTRRLRSLLPLSACFSSFPFSASAAFAYTTRFYTRNDRGNWRRRVERQMRCKKLNYMPALRCVWKLHYGWATRWSEVTFYLTPLGYNNQTWE